MARGWLAALEDADLADRVAIVGLVDLDLAAAARLRDEKGLSDVPVGPDLAGMVSATDADLLFDVVVPGARRQVVEQGLAAGCHVLSEKPLATSLEDARRLIHLASDAGRYHAVVQNRRYSAGVRRIRQLIDSGALGELTAIHADFFIGAHFGGFRDEMQNVLLLDMAIHTFDAARYMSARNARAVYCHQTNPRGSWYAHGAAANALFELEDDVTFTYRGSWAAEGANTSWESTWRVIGTRGTLLWDGAEGMEAHVVAVDEGFHRPLVEIAVPPPADAAKTRGHISVIADFLDAIDAGRAPETAGADNIKSLAMVLGAIESARTQSRLPIAGAVQ